LNSSWFRKLLLSYLPAFFMVITILFFLFFQALNEQNRKEAIKANDFLSQQVVQFTDTSLKSIDYRVLREILTSQVLGHFFKANQDDVYQNIQATKLIDDWKFNYPIIDSVYFIRLKDGFVLGDGSGTASELADEPFIRPYIEQKAAPGKWTGKRSYRPYTSEKAADVITMVRSYPNFATAKSGYIVVNVSLSKLQASLLPMYNPELTYVRISDGKGDVLLGNGGGNRKIDVFSRYISPYTGWVIESGPVNGKFTGLVLKSYNVWMIMALAAVILGALWVVRVTRRHYKPVSQLVSLIRTSSLIGQDEHPGGNEFGFIRGALERLMDEMQKTRQQHNESFILQKRHCFQEALDGTIPIQEEKWRADLIRYKIHPAGAAAFVQVLEIDRYHEFVRMYNQQDQSVLKFVLSSVVQEMAQASGATAWAEWTADRRLTAIIWVPDERREDGLDMAISGQIVEWVRGNLSFTVTLGVDGMASSLEEIRRSGENAAHMLQYKAVLGTGRALHPAKTESLGFRAHDFFGTIHLLVQSLRLPENNWDKHLDELFAQIRDSVSTRKEIESLVQFLHQHLNRMFSELSKEYRHIWRETEAGLAELERSWETASELHAAYSRIFDEMSHQMQTLRESQRTRVVIGEIRAYIEENYANPELSLEHLSDIFQMHAKNISKLFKEEFGENFVDFLIGLRIGHAKRLLATTEKTLTAISAEVGYYNYNSFNRAFKNVEGVSPSDYRKQADKSGGAVLPGMLLSREKV